MPAGNHTIYTNVQPKGPLNTTCNSTRRLPRRTPFQHSNLPCMHTIMIHSFYKATGGAMAAWSLAPRRALQAKGWWQAATILMAAGGLRRKWRVARTGCPAQCSDQQLPLYRRISIHPQPPPYHRGFCYAQSAYSTYTRTPYHSPALYPLLRPCLFIVPRLPFGCLAR